MLVYLEHLLDLLSGQVDVEFMQQLEDLTDAQAAVTVLIGLRERLLQPRDDMVKERQTPGTFTAEEELLKLVRGAWAGLKAFSVIINIILYISSGLQVAVSPPQTLGPRVPAGTEGYWSRVRCLLARLSSSLMPAIRYLRPVIQVRASSPVLDTRSRDSMCSP